MTIKVAVFETPDAGTAAAGRAAAGADLELRFAPTPDAAGFAGVLKGVRFAVVRGVREFAIMRPGTVIVNTSRGELVDEAAMFRALQERRLGGPELDVFEGEPLPADSPLRGLSSTVLTPHVADRTEDNLARMVAIGPRTSAPTPPKRRCPPAISSYRPEPVAAAEIPARNLERRAACRCVLGILQKSAL